MSLNKDSDRLELNFSNGALTKIKDLAVYFSVPEDQLKTILIKGVQILDEVKRSGSTYVIVEDRDGHREKIDIKSL